MISGIRAQTVEVFEEWASTKGVQEYFYKNVTKTDASKNVYVVGATLNGDGDYDLLITKFDHRGDLLWTDTIAGPAGGHDFATDLDFDHNGNVIVGGSISAGGAEGNNILVVKYEADGTELWRYSHDYNESSQGAASLVVDASGDIYLTGATMQSSGYTDMITLKIDANANLKWEQVHDYNNLHDAGVRVELSSSRVVVTGGGQYNGLTWKIWAMSYAPTDGTVTGSTTSSGTDPGVEEVTDLVIDDSNNIYIAGSTINAATGYDMLLIKLDEDLNIEWTKEWDGAGMTDKASGVRVAPNGDVYLCGTTETATDNDIALLKFNSNGNMVWDEFYDGADGGDDHAAALEWHNDGYLYVAGHTFKVSNLDYLTIKYDSTGTLIWDITYNSPYNKDDLATNLAIDDAGDIIVSGQCEKNDSVMTYYTVKYVEHSVPDHVLSTSGQGLGFIRNIGQLYKTNDSLASAIKYYSSSASYQSFACDTGFYMVQRKLSADSLANDSTVRVDVGFTNALTNCKVYGENVQRNYFNFYGYSDNVNERVPTYKAIHYPEVWRLIDLQIFSVDHSFQITAKPSAKLKAIKFSFEGSSSLTLDQDSNLVITTSLVPFVIPAPRVFQKNNQGMYEELGWDPYFDINQNVVSLNGLGQYDQSRDLVIVMAQPCTEEEIEFETELCYSTYFGGIFEDWVTATDLDDEGNLLVAGFTGNWQAFPDINLEVINPETNGAQMYLTKFFDDMVVDYSTIIFGNSEDYLHSAVFYGDAIYGCGATWSYSIPSVGVQAPHDPITSGNNLYSNAVVLRLDKDDGYLTWLTQLGAAGYSDSANDIKVDANSRIYMVGNCHHAGGSFSYEVLAGAYNETAENSGQTGFISRFQPSLELEWCTAFGGSETDFLNCIDIDNNGNIYIAGHTSSDDFYMEEVPDTYQKENINGASTYVLAKFNGNGQYVWSSFFGAGDEVTGGVGMWKNLAVAGDGSVFFGGSTRDPDGLDLLPPGVGYFSDVYVPNQGGLFNGYSFIAKFSESLSQEWTTLLGEGGSISQITTIELFEGTLVVGGTTKEETPLLHEIAGQYYYDELPFLFAERVTSFINVFNIYNNELQYGTLLSGIEAYNYRKIGGITISNNDEITIVGETESSYNCSEPIKDGIPVNPMPNDESYFQANNLSVLTSGQEYRAGFITRFCISELNTSIDSQGDFQYDINIFPNPSSDFVTVRLREVLIEGQLSIISLDGKLVHSQNVPSSNQVAIDVSDLKSGVYVIRLYADNTIITTARFIKL